VSWTDWKFVMMDPEMAPLLILAVLTALFLIAEMVLWTLHPVNTVTMDQLIQIMP